MITDAHFYDKQQNQYTIILSLLFPIKRMKLISSNLRAFLSKYKAIYLIYGNSFSEVLQTSNRFISIMAGKEKCSQCMYTFSMLKLPRKLPCCEHSICQPCIREIIDTKQDIIICGFCTARVKKEDIRVFSLNTSILLSLSQMPAQEQPQSHEEENQLLNDLAPNNYMSSRDNKSDGLCPLHRAPLDIVCISDKQRICPHCALFGNHREHRFKRLQDFEREIGEKKRVFVQIRNDKEKAFENNFHKIGEQLKSKIELKRGELYKLIEEQFKTFELQLKKRKETTFKQVNHLLSEYHQNFRKNGSMLKFQKIKAKLQQWEKTCLENLFKLDSTKKVQDRLYYYYEGPLQIVTQGHIFIQQLNNYSKQTLSKLQQQISSIKVKFDENQTKLLQNFVRVTKGENILTTSELKIQIEDDEGETNPFLDCTSSAIMLDKSNFINHNTSLQVQINSLSTSTQRISIDSFYTPIRKKPEVKNIRSIQKQRPRIQTNTSTNIKKPLAQVLTPKVSAQTAKRPTSELSFYKSPSKLLKSKEKIQNEEQLKPFDTKQPQKIYLQFSKNTLSDFFDLSQCNLSSDKVVQYVHRARRIHKIRGLKLCNNKLTTSGFQRMTQYLQGVSNINAANNLINQTVFDIILKYRDRLDSLKVINLSHNPINLDKKTATKMEEVKRLNIVVNL